MKSPYEFWRWMGVDKITAARLDRTETVEQLEELGDPELYDAPTDDQIRAAIVNSRKSLILIGHELDEISAAARSIRRWLIAAVVLILVLLLARIWG